MADLHENGDQMQQDDSYNGQDNMDHQNGGDNGGEAGRDDDR